MPNTGDLAVKKSRAAAEAEAVEDTVYEKGRRDMLELVESKLNNLTTLQGMGQNKLVYHHEMMAELRKLRA